MTGWCKRPKDISGHMSPLSGIYCSQPQFLLIFKTFWIKSGHFIKWSTCSVELRSGQSTVWQQKLTVCFIYRFRIIVLQHCQIFKTFPQIWVWSSWKLKVRHLRLIVSFEIQRAWVQSQNNDNPVTVLILSHCTVITCRWAVLAIKGSPCWGWSLEPGTQVSHTTSRSCLLLFWQNRSLWPEERTMGAW